jgi:hypothetical protein
MNRDARMGLLVTGAALRTTEGMFTEGKFTEGISGCHMLDAMENHQLRPAGETSIAILKELLHA